MRLRGPELRSKGFARNVMWPQAAQIPNTIGLALLSTRTEGSEAGKLGGREVLMLTPTAPRTFKGL